MIKTIELMPGITLRCFPDTRFKQGCLSVQLLRPMRRQEAAMNALLPAVLLRGTEDYPDLRRITLHLDDLYGASVGALVRRVGDYQTTGLSCGFIADEYALEGDRILEPLIRLIQQLLLRPVLEDGAFRQDYLESEKRNLIQAIETQRNDKRVYAAAQLMKHMCKQDSLGIPRLGEPEQVAAITARELYDHYQRILKESHIHLFYVGQMPVEQVEQLLRAVFADLPRKPTVLPPQSAFCACEGGSYTERLDVNQGKLCQGYVTDITIRDDRFAAMQVMNALFGGGMTSKLFMQVREKQSLCYDIGSGYQGSKGIMTVSAGIDFEMEQAVCRQIEAQLEACCQGKFTDEELAAAKQGLITQLQSTHDSPGAIENYYATGALSGLNRTPDQYMEQVCAVTSAQVREAARSLRLHTSYFLRGVR